MRRRFRWDKKYLYWGITALCVIAGAIAFYAALRFLPVVGAWIKKIFKILSPFVWGLAITYLLAPLMKRLEAAFLTKTSKRMKIKPKTARALAVLVSILVMIVIVSALVYLIIPQVYSSIDTIVTNSPAYFSKIMNWITVVLKDNERIEALATEALNTFNDGLLQFLQQKILPSLGNVVTNVTTGVYYVFIGIYNVLIGIIVSIYLLGNLETVVAGTRKVMYSIFSISTTEKIRSAVGFVNKTFMSFITGKLLDSAIIGLICYIVCAILKMPYALLVSVIVGVTNVIPFFGPFIGAIPSAIIILMVSPIKTLIFVIFIIILQQIDGNIIGPKILGSTVGVNGFWIMFSIILGAGLFGFWGMLLGVPVFAVIYAVIQKRVENKLKRSSLPQDTASYRDLDYIDSITRELIRPAEKALPEEGTEE